MKLLLLTSLISLNFGMGLSLLHIEQQGEEAKRRELLREEQKVRDLRRELADLENKSLEPIRNLTRGILMISKKSLSSPVCKRKGWRFNDC